MILFHSYSIFSFLLFITLTNACKPVFLVPGLMASRLHGNVTRKPHWYCSKIVDDDVWVNDVLVVPPLHNCLLEYIGLHWNNETNEVTEKEGVSIKPVDFGGLEGVAYVDEFEHDLHFAATYGPLADALKARGYVEKESLFGIPYDWRYGMAHPDAFWNQVKELVEIAYTKNNNEKVILVGHSMGSIFINYFCMTKMTKEWRDKYIDSAFLIAPSMGGSYLSFTTILTKMIPFLQIIGEFPDSAQKLGGVDIHIPNYVIFGDRPLYTNKDGKNYFARDLKQALIDEGIFASDPSIEKIYELNEDWPTRIPTPFDFPCSIVYNTALETLVSLDRSNGNDRYSYGPGDLMVNAEGIEYLCNNWNTTYKVDCLNLQHILPSANHLSIVWQNETMNYLFDHMDNDEWKKLRNL